MGAVIKGDKGEPGDPGRDGLTTSVTVNGETYEQQEGNINIGMVLREHQSLAAYRAAAAQDAIDAGKADADDVYTKEESDGLLAEKQNTINDLSAIRSGAGKGETAVQPAAISDMASKTWVEGKGYQEKRLFTITEDMFDIAFDDTKGVAPYSTSYGYTNITIHEDSGITWIEGAVYVFLLDTKVSVSGNRNVRLRIGEDDAWIPMMGTANTIAAGSTVFVKGITDLFIYKETYQTGGALHTLYDTNTTYTLNKLTSAGKYKAGLGNYAITRYALCMQKPDGTWEKIVDPTKTYTTATTKTVNTKGFLLNRIRYYATTANVAAGAFVATNYFDLQSASVDMRYSTNCGTPADWVSGEYLYLIGTVGADGLFYLDTSRWWSNALPSTNDGKLYIQIGVVLTDGSYTASFLLDRPIFYHDGTGIREYTVATGKQDDLTLAAGYDATKTQVLKHVNGSLLWVDE